MGVINHHSVIVTTWCDDTFSRLQHFVSCLDAEVKNLFAESSNQFGYHTMVMTPDGSNEGWEGSEVGDKVRSDFIGFIESFNYDDGSNPCSYVEVEFGELGQRVLRGNNANVYT